MYIVNNSCCAAAAAFSVKNLSLKARCRSAWKSSFNRQQYPARRKLTKMWRLANILLTEGARSKNL
jgi:hypothetical protein